MANDDAKLWKKQTERKADWNKELKALADDRDHKEKPDAYPEEPAHVIEERMLANKFPNRPKGRG